MLKLWNQSQKNRLKDSINQTEAVEFTPIGIAPGFDNSRPGPINPLPGAITTQTEVSHDTDPGYSEQPR